MTQDGQYLADITAFLVDYDGGSVPMTPCGLSYRNEWGPNRHAGKQTKRYCILHVVFAWFCKSVGAYLSDGQLHRET